jgi:biotin carboxyl carrier protein
MDINLNDLLRQFKSHPYEDHHINAPHTGVVSFKVKEGQDVNGPAGQWFQKPGTLLYVLDREKNPKRMTSSFTGQVAQLRDEFEGSFVQAGERLLTVRHKLNRDEIIERILKKVLHIFRAPQRARYFFTPEVVSFLEKKTEKGLSITPGDEIIIMSLMKRDSFLPYEGSSGIIYKVYFQQGELVEQNAPLFGVCPPGKLPFVQKVVQRIRTEWDD